MRTIVLSTPFAVLCIFGQASAQSPPPGNHSISGTVTSLAGTSCPLPMKLPATGVLYYPGTSRDTTELLHELVRLQKSVIVAYMNAFSAMPASGLNGWSATSPVSPNCNQYQNGALTGGGTAAILSFTLIQSLGNSPLSFAQGTMTINVDSISPCKETIQLIRQKVAPFEEIAG